MELHNRKSLRLCGYDYSNQNYYYITICTHNKCNLFWEGKRDEENGIDRSLKGKLNKFGKIAECELVNIQNHFKDVRVDKYVIMSNHIHAIIVIGCDGVEEERSRPFPTLSTIIGLYKSGVSKRIHETDPNIKIWQKSFNDHIIRSESGYREVWQYIDTNPAGRA